MAFAPKKVALLVFPPFVFCNNQVIFGSPQQVGCHLQLKFTS